MQYDDMLCNLNISRLLIDRLFTDVKITYNTKMIHIMVSFSGYQNFIFIDSFPYNHKKWQLYGILQIHVEMGTFSPDMQILAFSG